jgi:predicted HD phosphohydrolase
MEIDRRAFFAGLGGAAAVALMTDEAKADALEHHLMAQAAPSVTYPTVAELEAQIDTRVSRRGSGNLFVSSAGNVKRLPPLPAAPTLADYFKLRFMATSNHCLQSANRALKSGMSEDIILACLLHDTVQELIKVDHGWWGAQLYEPYVSDKVTFAIRYHQALRFFPDKAHGYEYPDIYRRMFGSDYTPEPYIEQTYQMVRKHKWYLEPRMVTVNDLYAFEPNVHPALDQFTDIIGRNFRQPKEGLGFDNSPVAHMWRSLAMPDHPL